MKGEQAQPATAVLALTPTTRSNPMVEATQSYRERMKAARAAASARRKAEKAAWKHRVELVATARMMALDAVKATIRDRGDRVTHYTLAQLRAQADEMMGPWMILKAKERIAARNSQYLHEVQRAGPWALTPRQTHVRNGIAKTIDKHLAEFSNDTRR
jgi:hypothetical protein